MKVAASAGGAWQAQLPEIVERAVLAGAELLVLPEANARQEPEASDGATARLLARLCREAGLAIVAGYVERCVTGIYNAALLVDRRGVCIANYRQAHVRPIDQSRLERGRWLSIMPLGAIRVGFLVGYDIEFPEAARALGLAGCDLLAVLGGATDEDAAILLPARARENRCWLIAGGPSARLIGPDGIVRSIATTGDLATGEIEHAPQHAAQPDYVSGRQPALYGILLHTVEEESRPE